MPGHSENLFYSFNMGPVHFIGFSTEVYFDLSYGLQMHITQFEWLERDLIEATRPDARAQRPWIITFGHRPMYCSNSNVDKCTMGSNRVRVGLPHQPQYGLERLFYRYGVDVELWAHEHSYERLWPIFNNKVSVTWFFLFIVLIGVLLSIIIICWTIPFVIYIRWFSLYFNLFLWQKTLSTIFWYIWKTSYKRFIY